MAVYKDKNGTWYVSARYTNWKGEADRKLKRGFQTKKEASEWERNFFLENAGNLEMTFEAFYELYKKNMQDRIKLSTWKMKESVIESKILPYFRKKRMCDIKPRDVVTWQNTMLKMRDDDGNPYSPVYLKTIHNQLSAIFNHAVKFYDLPNNPAQKAGNMGKEKSREMLFWTQEEYKAFAEAVMDKPISFYAFEVLYWGGLRLGELLALTRKDIDFKRGIIRINKSYQRIDGEDVMFNLTKRQLICFGAGAAVALPLFFLCKKSMDTSVASIIMIVVLLPFMLLAMYEKHGQPLEKIVYNIVQVCFLRPKQRPYRTNNFYAVLERQEKLDKEVYRIVNPTMSGTTTTMNTTLSLTISSTILMC